MRKRFHDASADKMTCRPSLWYKKHRRGESALMLVCARLCYVAGPQWGAKHYMDMEYLKELDLQNEADIIAG